MPAELPPDLARQLADILRRLDRLELSGRLPSASFGSGGIRVLDGGALSFLSGGAVVAKFDQDGYVDTGGLVDPATKALTGSFADMAAITFDPPASWGNYRIVAQGGVTIKNSNVDNTKRSRLLIGASASDVLVDNNGGISIFDHPLAHSVGSTSGQSNVAVQSRQADTNIAPDKLWASVSFIAIRIS